MNHQRARSAPADLESDRDRRLIDHFLNKMIVPQITVILLGLIESFLVWNHSALPSYRWIIGWSLYLLLVTGYRLEIIRRYRQKGTSQPIAYWKRRLTLGMFASGLAWGLAWWLPGLHPPATLVFINLILLTGLVAGSTVTNFWIPWGSRVFALPILITLALYLVRFPTDVQLLGVLMLLLFWITVDLAAQTAYQGYCSNVALTVQAERISSELDHKNQALTEEIGQRTLMEQMIQRDREELLLVIDSIPAFTGIVTADFRLRRINRAFAQALGIQPEDPISIDLAALLGPEQFPRVKTHLTQVMTGLSQISTMEIRLHPNHGEQHFLAHFIPSGALSTDAGREFILLLEDVTSLKRREHSLHHEAYHDALTGLGNRRLLEERLMDALDQVHLGMPGILILLDLDGFKSINDREGHAAGDTILTAVARALLSAVRKSDTACRLGGDEFAIVLPGAPLETAEKVAVKIQGRIREETRAITRKSSPPTASIGLVALEAGDINPEDWIAAADRGLYEAKRQGGNRHAWGRLTHP